MHPPGNTSKVQEKTGCIQCFHMIRREEPCAFADTRRFQSQCSANTKWTTAVQKKKKKNLPGKKLTKHYCGPTWKNSSTKYSTTGKTSGHQGSGWPAQNATADDWQKMAFDITTSLVMDRSFTTKVYQQAGMERIILRSWGVRSVPVEKTRNFLDKKKKTWITM